MNGLYYFTKKVYHFYQSKPVYELLGGKIITISPFPLTFFYFLVKYGPFRVSIMNRRLNRLKKKAKGLVLGQSADNYVPVSKNYERIFVYHGTSDKRFDFPDGKLDLSWFEHYFVSGPKDLYKLKKYSHNSHLLEKRVVKIGMFRSDPLFNGGYDKKKILKNFGIVDGGKKIILYAPTWEWGGGTLGRCYRTFARELCGEYVFVIRPHYNDRKNKNDVLEWQKRNRLKDFYIFHRQQHDVMELIYIADLMIGDNSAVNYDFALTKKPMVFVKSENHDVFTPPDEFNVKLCGPLYDPDTDRIGDKVIEALRSSEYRRRLAKLVDRSFYFNDGHAADRACSFIIDRLSEKGLIDRERAYRKYGAFFTYTDSYKHEQRIDPDTA